MYIENTVASCRLPSVQYHALGLLYHIRKHDRLAISKLVAKYARSSLRSPYAVCLLVSDHSALDN